MRSQQSMDVNSQIHVDNNVNIVISIFSCDFFSVKLLLHHHSI